MGFMIPFSSFLCIYIFPLQDVEGRATSITGQSRASDSVACS